MKTILNRTEPSDCRTITIGCDYCGITFEKKKCEIHEHNFCCREHFYYWNACRISHYNSCENPMNKPGGVLEAKIRRSHKCRVIHEVHSYRKLLGRHEQRRVAEAKIGRPLRKGEVVHHIDGNKLNNSPDNLMVLQSQAEHARIHFSKGGEQ
jgi:hypothetical protein